MTVAILVSVGASVATGRDLPGNVAGVVLAALSAAFASDALASRKGRDRGSSDDSDGDG
jgi:hypothetical protein